MSLHAQLRTAWERSGSMLCVGLDPDVDRLPPSVGGSVFEFCRAIIDATADLACAVKPQIAHFAAIGAERDLEALCRHVREAHPHLLLVLDAKRGDIGTTAAHYATEAFDRYGAHAVTVNPYLGLDSVTPFLEHPHGAVFVLCRTSNEGSGEFQALDVGGEPLYLRVARRVADHWSTIGECGLVVGATYPTELAAVRGVVGDLPLLVPGIGAQGGDVEATVRAGRSADGFGMVVNSSRAILYAGSGADFPDAARIRAEATRDALRAVTG